MPPPVARIALVLHGRVPSWRGGELTDASHPTFNASRRSLARFAAGSMRRHVLEANRADGVACYVHSWNPELADVWATMLHPAAELHQPINSSLSALRSQHVSMQRAVSLVPLSIRLILLSRNDVLLFADMHLRPLLSTLYPSDEALWLPHSCQTSFAPARFGELGAVHEACGCQAKRKPCEGISGRGQAVEAPSVGRYGFRVAADEGQHSLFVQDWMFVATPSIARSFGRIHEQFERYESAIHARAAVPTWAHFYWAHHITHVLPPSVRVRFLPDVIHGIDLVLARFIRFGRDCEARVPESSARALGRSRNHTRALTRAPAAVATHPRLVNQCPARLRSGEHIMCPWYAPVCPDGHAEATVTAVRRAENALRRARLATDHPFLRGDVLHNQDRRIVLKRMLKEQRFRRVRARGV